MHAQQKKYFRMLRKQGRVGRESIRAEKNIAYSRDSGRGRALQRLLPVLVVVFQVQMRMRFHTRTRQSETLRTGTLFLLFRHNYSKKFQIVAMLCFRRIQSLRWPKNLFCKKILRNLQKLSTGKTTGVLTDFF